MAPDPTAPDTGDDRRRSHQGLGRRQRGQCLCGAVVFTIDGPLRPVVTCHCHMCQRFHGGPGPYTAAETAHIRFDGDAPPSALTWHRSSDTASRGFCRTCGSSLFWRPVTAGYTAIAAGCLDQPSGLAMARHIFVADKGDWYQIGDGLPQLAAGHGTLPPVTQATGATGATD